MMSTIQAITKNAPEPISVYAISNSTTEQKNVLSSLHIEPRMTYLEMRPVNLPVPAMSRRSEWIDDEYRQAYMEASVEEGIAWQIRANRNKRALSQEALALMIDSTQSGISRLEDPEYGRHSIETLIKLAHAFECALSVKFISFSRLAEESEDLSPEAMYAAPFLTELKLLGGKIER